MPRKAQTVRHASEFIYSTIVTEGGADAFVIQKWDLGITVGDPKALTINWVVVNIDPAAMPPAGFGGAGGWIEWAMTDQPVLALPALDSDRLIYRDGLYYVQAGVVPAGVGLFDLRRVWVPESPIVLGGPSVFFSLDSANSGVAVSIGFRIGYSVRTASATEYLLLRQG